MGNLYDWDAVEFIDNDGSDIGDGEPDSPNAVGNVTQGFKKKFPVAQNVIQTLWDAGNSTDPPDFSYVRIKSDVGDPVNGFVMVEFTTDENNLIGRMVFTVGLFEGLAIKLGSSVSYAAYVQNFAGGTLSKIQRIRVKNLNSTTANVLMVMAK